MARLTRQGWIEIARRAGAEVALVAASVAGLGHGLWVWSAGALGVAALIYILPPRPRPPAGAWFAGRGPAVIMPDLLGALLATTFFALPFLIAAHDPLIGSPLGPFLLTGPPGLAALAIFWIAARSQCFWIAVAPEGLRLATIRGEVALRFDDIVAVRPAERRLPGWVGRLLVLFGGLRGAGMALLQAGRVASYLVVERRSGPALSLPVDAVDRLDALLARLDAAGVALVPVHGGRDG